MSATPKLTKKQKKSLAFRTHKTTKRQHRNDQEHKNGLTSMGDDAYPTLEDQDIRALDGGEVEVEGDAHEEDGAPVGYKEGNAVQRKKSKVGKQIKGATEEEDVPVVVAVLKEKDLKRKREGEGEGEEGHGKAKKAKQTSAAEKEVDNEKTKDKTKQKLILFVGGSFLLGTALDLTTSQGNLKYTTTKETIAHHFALCGASFFLLLR